MATLYRKYRPQTFSELVGQDHVRETLTRALVKEKLTHAYLFVGPRGTGKTTTARLLARRANCLTPKGVEACGTCRSCAAFRAGRNIDVIEVDAASNRGIDDIRALREATAFMPSLGKYKVYIIDEVHMLTKEAAAALLKTLEEPREHVLFILATTELHKVLPTILSRCQVFRFRRASRAELTARLTYVLEQEKRSASNDVLDFIIDRADGCYRDAESLLGQMLTLQEEEITRDEMASFLGLPSPELLKQFLRALVAGQSAPAIEAADTVFATGIDPEQFLREGVRSARDEAVLLSLKKKVTWSASLAEAEQRLPQIIRALLQALQDLAYVPQPMIAIHLAILTVCSERGTASPPPQNPGTPQAASAKPAAASAPTVPAEQRRAKVVPVKQRAAAAASLEVISKMWPKLIDIVKQNNPVAATFLRAVHPAAVAGQQVTVQTQFALHRTFFEKPKMSRLIADELSRLIKRPVILAFVLEEETTRGNVVVARQRHQEDFRQTIQEVFGAA